LPPSPSSANSGGGPAPEVRALMRLFRSYLTAEAGKCAENGIRISVIGRRDRLSPGLVRVVEEAGAATAGGGGREGAGRGGPLSCGPSPATSRPATPSCPPPAACPPRASSPARPSPA